MTAEGTFVRSLKSVTTRHSSLAVIIYVGLVALFIAATGYAVMGLYDSHAAVAESRAVLDQLEGRRPVKARATAEAERGLTPAGSPYLEGETVTVAGATLLQRVSGAVAGVGGQVLSSQIDLQGARAKEDFISVVANCELDQPALQQLLYDIEGGMPYLFVDQLVVQTAEGSTRDDRRLRVLLGVSGQWRNGR